MGHLVGLTTAGLGLVYTDAQGERNPVEGGWNQCRLETPFTLPFTSLGYLSLLVLKKTMPSASERVYV